MASRLEGTAAAVNTVVEEEMDWTFDGMSVFGGAAGEESGLRRRDCPRFRFEVVFLVSTSEAMIGGGK